VPLLLAEPLAARAPGITPKNLVDKPITSGSAAARRRTDEKYRGTCPHFGSCNRQVLVIPCCITRSVGMAPRWTHPTPLPHRVGRSSLML